MNLLIVESPAKAKTIEKYLDNKYKVVASVGHIRDIPKSNKKAIDIEAGFVPHYEIAKGKEKVVSLLKKEASKADEVLLATDPDREGEAIAWHIEELLGGEKMKRIVFNEITEGALKDALKHPREVDTNLRQAQEARRILDRLVGYDLSGLIWKKLRYGLSAGRVQSPAMRILMEREREIRAFIPETFWELEADVKNSGGNQFTLSCVEEPRNRKLVDEILTQGKKNSWIVSKIEERKVSQSPRAPFITSTLQQVASTRLGMSPSWTMSAAQKLYEGGHITYMRTDSTNLASTAVSSILAQVTKEFGKEYAETHIYRTRSKNAQEAHEAIRPTNIGKKTAGATDEQRKLYTLIRERTLASQMAMAKVMRTKMIVRIGETGLPNFAINGSRIIFPGWMAADSYIHQEDVILPEVKVDEELKLIDIRDIEKQTQPPNRYSEAGLIKELEKREIGRPSTYASIIRTIVDREYVTKEGKTLIPTDIGDVVTSFLEEHFAKYIGDSFTKEMENELDEIANGKRGYKETLENFYTPFLQEVHSKEDLPKITNLGPVPDEFPCPECNKNMTYKLGKTGKFMSCAEFPECAGARTIEGKILEPPKELGKECPRCKKGKLIIREGRFGKFVTCNTYPKCKYVQEDEEEASKKRTGVKCTECKNGEMTERRGRFGIFYSCTNYPDCKHAIKALPTGNMCPLCNKLMMEGTKTIPERCSDKSCPNHNPHKLDKEKK